MEMRKFLYIFNTQQIYSILKCPLFEFLAIVLVYLKMGNKAQYKIKKMVVYGADSK